MIKNTYISLDTLSSLRNDAVNSIKYTLLLDYHLPNVNNMDNLIPTIMKGCHECCRGLFQNDTPINFNFFGLPSSSKPSGENDRLSFLDTYSGSIDNKKISSREEVGFPTMILDHCILSCYHAVLTDLLHKEMVTSYQISNGLKKEGIYSLYLKNRLDFTAQDSSKTSEKSILKKSGNNSYNCSKAAEFTKSVQTHFKALPHLKFLFVDNSNPTSNKYFLQFSWLLYQVCNINAHKWKIFSSSVTKENKEMVLQNFENLSREISPKFNDSHPISSEEIFFKHFDIPTDGLYSYYIKERVFNFNLVYSLLRNIRCIEKRISQENIFSMLSACQKLPNVFSRQYFLQYAFDKMSTEPISHLNFWHDHCLDMNKDVSPIEYGTEPETHFQSTMWIKQFSYFCNYMAEYVIPIYEWCFTNMLMEVIELNFPSEAHIKHLEKVLKALGKYMGDNYRRIIRPIEIPASQELLDIITPHEKGVMDLDYPADFLQQVLNEFCSTQRELDLNLIPLTPDFFITGGNQTRNKDHIRNFYINLLYP